MSGQPIDGICPAHGEPEPCPTCANLVAEYEVEGDAEEGGSGSQSTNESDVVTASDLDSISRSFISISEERELRRQVGALEARIAEMAGEVSG